MSNTTRKVRRARARRRMAPPCPRCKLLPGRTPKLRLMSDGKTWKCKRCAWQVSPQ